MQAREPPVPQPVPPSHLTVRMCTSVAMGASASVGRCVGGALLPSGNFCKAASSTLPTIVARARRVLRASYSPCGLCHVSIAQSLCMCITRARASLSPCGLCHACITQSLWPVSHMHHAVPVIFWVCSGVAELECSHWTRAICSSFLSLFGSRRVTHQELGTRS